MSSVTHRPHELQRWLTLYSMSEVETYSKEIKIELKEPIHKVQLIRASDH